MVVEVVAVRWARCPICKATSTGVDPVLIHSPLCSAHNVALEQGEVYRMRDVA